MISAIKIRQMILAVGDILVFYVALAATLFIRYNNPFAEEVLSAHIEPFSILFIVWTLVFYISGLYEIRTLKGGLNFVKKIGSALVVNTIVSIAFFYFIPAYGIAPKTNLFVFLIIIFFLEYFWRKFYNDFLIRGAIVQVLFTGSSPTTQQLIAHLRQNPHLGYEAAYLEKPEEISENIIAKRTDLVVVPAHIKKNSDAARTIYKNLITGTEIIDAATFYETIFGKIPIAELEEFWFLDNLINRHKTYDLFRLPLEMLLAIVLGLIFLPLLLLIAFLIKCTSAGPVIIKQVRVGELGKNFIIYKLRSMRMDAEKDGVRWARENDPRITFLGKILRRAHLDEIPQLINIIKGDLSFVGPRPERPEFTESLKKIIPYYELRHIIKPGLTGWAQLNYRYGASIEDAREKLQYDLYYLKNRSFWLDLSIIIKTIKLLFTKN